MITEVVFLLEEPSAERVIQAMLPKILPEADVQVRYFPFEGKQDLERQMVRRIKFYRNPQAVFVVVRDQDAHPDCRAVKKRLVDLCKEAGRSDVLVRIVCRALESWYLGDLAAVEVAFGVKGVSRRQASKKLRNPDLLHHPDREFQALVRGPVNKGQWARQVGPHLDPERSCSPSLRAFVSGLRRLAG